MNRIKEFWQAVKKHYKLVVSWFDEDDEWHKIHVDSQMNHGQGPRRDKNEI